MKARKIFLIVVIIEAAVIFLYAAKAYYIVSQSRQEVRKVEKKLAQLELENKRLREEEAKAKDPFYLEKLAREKLGLAKKNEIIYKIVP